MTQGHPRERLGEERAKVRMIRPGVAAPGLAPRLGLTPFREKGGVRYLELETRSLMNRCSSREMPFEWTVNPYRGCAMGCRYCYATYTHEFLGVTSPEAFHSTVFVKRGGQEETARALARVVRRGERIALGTATDPYQPGEPMEGVTRRFLEMVARHRGVRISITTKGAGILKDMDLLSHIHSRSSLSIHVSLISMDASLLREIEPLAPPPEARIEVLRRLVAAGLDAGISVAPVLPLLTDSHSCLEELLGRASGAGVRRMFHSVLFLRSPTREKYLGWLEAAFPEKVSAYRRAYAGRVRLPPSYGRRIGARLSALREKHGFDRTRTSAGRGAFLPSPLEQLALFPALSETRGRRNERLL